MDDRWIKIKDRLPKVIYTKDREVNCVLTHTKDGWECSSDFQISNTAYINKNPNLFTYWMSLPKAPKD